MLQATRYATGTPASGIGLFNGAGDGSGAGSLLWGLISTASMGLSAYHGYKRNDGSVGWAVGWGLLGGIFPVITPAIAFAQGLGEKKRK